MRNQQDTGASDDRALASEAPTGLQPPAFDPSRAWPLQDRHQRLPKWARLEMAQGICATINDDMAPDIREAAKRAFGGNCTFSDDDLNMLEHFACWALDQGYRAEIKDPRTIQNIARAVGLRAIATETGTAETGTGSVHESAGPSGHRQTSVPIKDHS